MDTELLKLIITGIISPTIALGAKYYFDKKSKESRFNECCENIELLDHPFFERMKCLRTHIQYTFELKNKGKELVFKDLLISKFNITIEEYWIMSKEIELKKDKLTETELHNIIIDHMREGLKRHEAYYKTGNYTVDEQRCLEIVLQKFNKWHAPRLDNMIQSVQNICASKFYSGIITKSSVALDVLLGGYTDIINDAELSLNDLNGDLKGLTFKGIKL